MPHSNGASAQPHLLNNRLLAALLAGEFAAIAPPLEIVYLDVSEVIADPVEPLPHAYLPLGGVISIVAIDVAGGIVEVGAIGRDGMAGLPAVLGLPASRFQAMDQIAGTTPACRWPSSSPLPCRARRRTPCSCATSRPFRC